MKNIFTNPKTTFLAFACTVFCSITFAQNNHVVISQFFGGGGTAASVYNNDFVELFNPTYSAVDLSGWSLQYTPSTTGALNVVVPLNGSIPAHGYFLISLGRNTTATGVGLPAPDVSDPGKNIGAINVKLALVNSTTLQSYVNPSGYPAVVDFVGIGGVNGYEGTGSAPAGSITTSVLRKASAASTAASMALGGAEANAGNGWDTNDNSADFVAQPNMVARNSSVMVPEPLSSSPTITFTNNSGFSDNIAQDGEGGSVVISDINIQVMPINNSGSTLTSSPLEYHDGTDPNWGGYPPIITYGNTDPHYGWSIKSANGAEFSLVSVDFMDWGDFSPKTFMAEAFRDGASLGTVTFNGNTSLTPVHLANTGILTNIFQNVDEVRLYKPGFNDDTWPAVNNIKVSTAATALPVRFTSFTAQPKNSVVALNWITASEQNSQHFEVERSANGILYTKIGTVTAAGNSHVTNSYEFTDAAPLQGNSFYRLKQVDMDGKAMYSTIQKVVIGGEGFSYTLLQNPASSQLKLNIQLSEAQKLKLEVRDARGVLLIQQQQQFSSGNTTYTLPIAHLASGTYFINIITEKGSNAKSFLKQ